MDLEEKKRLKELAGLEEKYGHLSENDESEEARREKVKMRVEGASLRDIDRIKEKRREK